jgi:flagellar hook-basal body complex protein FliE
VPIAPISFPVAPVPGFDGIAATSGALAPSQDVSGDFATVLASAADRLQGAQSKADALAVQAATGDLRDVHDYSIASTEAGLMTDMTVTLRNKAVEAFSEIMRMPL